MKYSISKLIDDVVANSTLDTLLSMNASSLQKLRDQCQVSSKVVFIAGKAVQVANQVPDDMIELRIIDGAVKLDLTKKPEIVPVQGGGFSVGYSTIPMDDIKLMPIEPFVEAKSNPFPGKFVEALNDAPDLTSVDWEKEYGATFGAKTDVDAATEAITKTVIQKVNDSLKQFIGKPLTSSNLKQIEAASSAQVTAILDAIDKSKVNVSIKYDPKAGQITPELLMEAFTNISLMSGPNPEFTWQQKSVIEGLGISPVVMEQVLGDKPLASAGFQNFSKEELLDLFKKNMSTAVGKIMVDEPDILGAKPVPFPILGPLPEGLGPVTKNGPWDPNKMGIGSGIKFGAGKFKIVEVDTALLKKWVDDDPLKELVGLSTNNPPIDDEDDVAPGQAFPSKAGYVQYKVPGVLSPITIGRYRIWGVNYDLKMAQCRNLVTGFGELVSFAVLGILDKPAVQDTTVIEFDFLENRLW